jgi:hypothetical protein
VALVVGVGIWHGLVSYGWTGQLKTPTGAKTEFVNVTCGPPWGSSYVHIPSISHPIEAVPCGQRQQYRVMIAADVVVGAGVIAVLVGRTRRARPAPPAA